MWTVFQGTPPAFRDTLNANLFLCKVATLKRAGAAVHECSTKRDARRELSKLSKSHPESSFFALGVGNKKITVCMTGQVKEIELEF
jgi:hypothetical protein